MVWAVALDGAVCVPFLRIASPLAAAGSDPPSVTVLLSDAHPLREHTRGPGVRRARGSNRCEADGDSSLLLASRSPLAVAARRPLSLTHTHARARGRLRGVQPPQGS